MRSLPNPYTALVIGASGTLGKAFCDVIGSDPACSQLIELSRSFDTRFDLTDPARFAELVSDLGPTSPFSLVIDATGVLSVGSAGPEKSLATFDSQAAQAVMQINAFGPIALLRELAPQLSKGRCVMGKLSARVGSISDNRLGGWYSYRASKAALNMLLQTAAIELHRKLPGLVVAAMQPGTVVSSLSRRFVSLSTPTVSAIEAATGLLAALDELPAGASAHFVDYRGQSVPW